MVQDARLVVWPGHVVDLHGCQVGGGARVALPSPSHEEQPAISCGSPTGHTHSTQRQKKSVDRILVVVVVVKLNHMWQVVSYPSYTGDRTSCSVSQESVPMS